MLFSEFNAIKDFAVHPDDYWQLDRRLRAAMVGHHMLTNIQGAMMQHDSHEEAKRKAKHKGRK